MASQSDIIVTHKFNMLLYFAKTSIVILFEIEFVS